MLIKTPNKRILEKRKLIPLLLSVMFFLVTILMTEASVVHAHLYAGLSVLDHQIPVPGYKKPKCDKTDDPEFHSLRPYQTAACGDSDKTYFCWNNYNLLETFSTRWDPDTCTPNGSTWQCEYGQDIEKVYVVDGEYARFPIMGNTEAVTNSQGPK